MPFRSEFRRWFQKRECGTWRQHARWLLKFYRWRYQAFRERVTATGPADFTAIVLSYKRPQNIDLLVRLLLATPSVGTVIVSNNNADIRLHPWIAVDDPRVTIIEQPVNRPCLYRYALARRSDAGYFIAVDDDLFLTPDQLEHVCKCLREHPEVPHGIFGSQYDSWSGILSVTFCREASMALLHRLYAFTADHVREFYRLMDAMGFHVWHYAWRDKPPTDDVFLSFSGSDYPRIHNVGPFLDCPSSDASGIACFREADFFLRRFDIFCSLRRLKPFHRT
ncbi:MAG: hypothetical protein PHZ00_05095 [Candidatus Peribacteraceae bacterium]|nr:hypothetical protein [Candidatus Peribacteraceae bacterium]